MSSNDDRQHDTARRRTVVKFGPFRIDREDITKDGSSVPERTDSGPSEQPTGGDENAWGSLVGISVASVTIGLVVGFSAVGLYRRMSGHTTNRMRQLSREVGDLVSESAGVMRRATEPVQLSRSIADSSEQELPSGASAVSGTMEMSDAKQRPLVVHVLARADDVAHKQKLGWFRSFGMQLLGSEQAPWEIQKVVVDVPDSTLAAQRGGAGKRSLGAGSAALQAGVPVTAAVMGARGFETCVEEAHFREGERGGEGEGAGGGGRAKVIAEGGGLMMDSIEASRGKGWTRGGDEEEASGESRAGTESRATGQGGLQDTDGSESAGRSAGDVEDSSGDTSASASECGYGQGQLWRSGRAGSSPLEQAGLPFWRVLVHPVGEARAIAGRLAQSKGKGSGKGRGKGQRRGGRKTGRTHAQRFEGQGSPQAENGRGRQ